LNGIANIRFSGRTGLRGVIYILYVCIQGVSRLVDITAGGDVSGLIDQNFI